MKNVLFLLALVFPVSAWAVTRTLTHNAPAQVYAGQSLVVSFSASTDAGGGEQVGFLHGLYSIDGGANWTWFSGAQDCGPSTTQNAWITAGAPGSTIIVFGKAAFRWGPYGDVDYNGNPIDWGGSWSTNAQPPAKFAYISVVAQPNQPPAVNWVQNPASAYVNQWFPIQARGSDPDGNLSGLYVWREWVPHAFSGGGNGWEYYSDPNLSVGTSAGTVTFQAQAADSAGAASPVIYHSVTIVNRPPSGTFTVNGSAGNSSITFGQTVSVSSTVTDADGNLTIHSFWWDQGSGLYWTHPLITWNYPPNTDGWLNLNLGSDGYTVSNGSSSTRGFDFRATKAATFAFHNVGADPNAWVGIGATVIYLTVNKATPVWTISNPTFPSTPRVVTTADLAAAFASFRNPYAAAVAQPTGSITYAVTSATGWNASPTGPITPGSTALNAGTYTVTATYGGDSNYNATSANSTFTVVNPAPVNVSMTTNKATYAFGEPITAGARSTDAFGDLVNHHYVVSNASYPTNSWEGTDSSGWKWRHVLSTGISGGDYTSSITLVDNNYGGGRNFIPGSYKLTLNTQDSVPQYTYNPAATLATFSVVKATPNAAFAAATKTPLATVYTVVAGDLNASFSNPYTTLVAVPSGAAAYSIAPGSANGTVGAPVTTGTTLTGGVSYTIRATYPGDGNYLGTSADAVWTINRGTQGPLAITSAASASFGQPYTATATGGNGSGALVWALGTGSTAAGAAINPSTGAVTTSGLGTVVFKVYRLGDTNFNQSATTADFTLGVNTRGTQDPVTITSGSAINFGATYSATATGGTGSGALVWGLGVGSTAPGAAINASTGAVSYTGTGTVVFNCYREGDINYNPSATTPNFTLTINKASQSISFGALANKTYGAAPFTVAATASSNLPVTLAIASGPATISGATVTITGAGAVTVRASQAGDANYLAATDVDQSFSVGKADQAALVLTTTATQVYGTTQPLIVAGGSGSGAITYAITAESAPGAAALAGSAPTMLVANTGIGAAEVQATKAADANYNAVTSNIAHVDFAKAAATINFGGLAQIYDGMPKQVSATSTPAGLSIDVTYNGISAAPIAAGNYDVGAAVDDPNYEGSATQTLIVSKATAAIFLNDLYQIHSGGAYPVFATTQPEDLATVITYNGSSSVPTNAGTYAVTATVDDINYQGSATGTLVVAGDTEPPSTPGNPGISGINSTYLRLAWDASTDNVGVTGYDVYVNGTFYGSTPNTSMTVANLAPNTAHNFSVRARDAAGNASGPSGEVSGTTNLAVGSPFNTSLWLDTDGDGILDRVSGSNTNPFSYFVAAWSTTNPSYYSYPINNFIFRVDNSVDGQVLGGFSLAWIPVVDFWTTWTTHFDVHFIVATESDRPTKIYRDQSPLPPSGQPDPINPGNWNPIPVLVISEISSPQGWSIQNITYPISDPNVFNRSRYFAVQKSEPVGTIEMTDSAGTSLGTVTPGGTVNVAIPANTGLVIKAKDVLGKLLDAASNKVVFSVKDTLGHLVPLPNNGLLDVLDIGIDKGGQWQIGVKLGGQSDAQTVWFVVNVSRPELEKVEWVAKDSALDANPNTGGGLRIFAGKSSPSDTVNRENVTIRAKLTQPISGVAVSFKVFDVDDPSATGGVLDNESSGTDNRGTWSQPAVSSMPTDSSGVAEVTFTVSKQPGDNFRAVATIKDPAILASISAKQSDSLGRLKDGANRIVNNSTDLQVSEMLTVWRHMHIEVDSMGVPTGNDITGTVTNVGSILLSHNRNVTTNVILNDSANRFEKGIFKQGANQWPVQSSSTGANFRFTIERSSASTPDPVAGPFDYVRDDDMITDVPAPDCSHLEMAFKPAYVVPLFDGAGNPANDQSNIAFRANVEGAAEWEPQKNAGKNSPELTNDYWAVYVQGAFQGVKGTDNDPDSETNELAGETGRLLGKPRGSLIYMETVRDAAPNQKLVVAHEVGHYFYGGGEESDGSLMDSSTRSGNFNKETLRRIRAFLVP